MENLLGFGNGARTATAKVGKVSTPASGRLIGFANGEKAVTAKVGKNIEEPPAAKS